VAEAVREQASAIHYGVRSDRSFAQYRIGNQWVDRQYDPLKARFMFPLGIQQASGNSSIGSETCMQRFEMRLRDWVVTITATSTDSTPDIDLTLEYSAPQH